MYEVALEKFKHANDDVDEISAGLTALTEALYQLHADVEELSKQIR